MSLMQQHFPTTIVKQHLLDMNHASQIKAVEALIKVFKTSNKQIRLKVAEDLVIADVSEILCERFTLLDTEFTGKVFLCLSFLLKTPKFFLHNHAAYVIDSVLRVLVMSNTESPVVLQDGLTLLKKLLKGLRINEVQLSNVCDVTHVLELIERTLRKHGKGDTIKLLGEVTVKFLLFKEVCNEELLIRVISLILERLSNLKDRSGTSLIGSIIALSLRGIFNEQSKQLMLLIPLFIEIVSTYLVPYLTGLRHLTYSQKDVFIVLSSLMEFYFWLDKENLAKISFILASNQFLPFLLELCSRDQRLLQVARSLLSELLINLSEENLGEYNWRLIVEKGLSELPLETSSLLHLFSRRSYYARVSVIIYYYFNFLSSKIPQPERYLSQAVAFLLENEFAMPLPCKQIFKAFWLVFAICHLSNQIDARYSKLVLEILSSSPRSYYTHHHSILYWAFSESVHSAKFQMDIVKLWLENGDEESISEIVTLAATSKTACSALLNMLICGRNMVLDKALETLCEIVVLADESLVSKIKESAWGYIPSILSSFCPTGKGRNIRNIACFLAFCSKFIPCNPNQTILNKISWLLPNVLCKYSFISSENDDELEILTSALHFATILLELSLTHKNIRVLATFINNKDLFHSVENCLASENAMLSQVTLKFLAVTVHFQCLYTLRCKASVHLPVSHLTKMLSRGSELILLGIMLEAMMNSSTEEPLVSFSSVLPSQLTSLYSRLHMIFIKLNNEEMPYCWKCIHQILIFSNKLAMNLAFFPLTCNLLTMSQPGSNEWNEMMAFLPTWLDGNFEQFTTSDRQLKPTRAQKTITHIINIVLSDKKQSHGPQTRKAITKILQLGAIPSNVKILLTEELGVN